MLYKKTIEPTTLELLKKIMIDPNVEPFALAGGTALALLIGHRKSVDLDFFTKIPFDSNDLYNKLENDGFIFDKTTIDLQSNTINGHIDGVQVQFLGHIYTQVSPFKNEEGIWFYDLPDIAAMKLNAITNRGAKKDFWDYAEFLNIYSLKEMLGFYEKKYNKSNFVIVLKSLTYFDEAESQKDPVCLNGQTWKKVKKLTEDSVRDYMKLTSKKINNKGLYL